MDLLNVLFQYNGYIFVFSASGFLISLFWYILSERKRRDAKSTVLKKSDLLNEKAFFGEFDGLENPALKMPSFPQAEEDLSFKDFENSDENNIFESSEDLKPIFEQLNSENTEALDKSQLPKFPEQENVEPVKFKNFISQPKEAQIKIKKSEPEPEPEPEIETKTLTETKTANERQDLEMPPLPFEVTSENFDEDEKRVRQLLDQIKKDLQQGENS